MKNCTKTQTQSPYTEGGERETIDRIGLLKSHWLQRFIHSKTSLFLDPFTDDKAATNKTTSFTILTSITMTTKITLWIIHAKENYFFILKIFEKMWQILHKLELNEN